MQKSSSRNKKISRVRNFLEQKNLDALLVTKHENIRYLSGFTGSTAVLVIFRDRQVILTDFRYIEQASKQCEGFEVIRITDNFFVEDYLKGLEIKRLGFEGADISFELYSKYVIGLKDVDAVNVSCDVDKLRIIKDEEELECIRMAANIADEALAYILTVLKPGITEYDIASELEYKMKKLGASGASFESIIASGVRSSLPHGVASNKVIEYGDVVTIDFGAVYNGYCSDMTRTVFVGKVDPDIEKIYNIVRKAQVNALEGAVSGVTGKYVDSIAREIIRESGYGENFGHGLGHGVGLEIHEEPRISQKGETLLEDNMVITIEPGIYIQSKYGVRIEDLIIIRGNKPEILSKSPKEIIVL